jgi:hypothetical protein
MSISVRHALHGMLIILLLALATSVAGAGRRDSADLDSTFLRGAYKPVPCNDGSIIGGTLLCPYYYSSNPNFCRDLIMSRSLDGGVTWDNEAIRLDSIRSSEIVRLRGGRLLSAGNVFMQSTDNGRSWQVLYDGVRAAEPTWNAFNLVRDYRGLIYWYGGGLFVSLDNGRTRIWMQGSNPEYNFHVLPPHGHILIPRLEGWRGSAELRIMQLSTDHGRSWSVTLQCRDGDGAGNANLSVYWDYDVIDDTMAVSHSYYDDKGEFVSNRTLYYHSSTQQWKTGRWIESIDAGGVLDSTRWYFGRYSSQDLSGPVDTTYRPYSTIRHPYAVDRYGNKSDTLNFPGKIGSFYDLDGNVHPQVSDYYFPARARRPVSRLDKIYTCTGVEYVVGGRQLQKVGVDGQRSSNARVSTIYTPNRRMATITVTAIDSTQPVRVRLTVDDAVLGRQWFTDSVPVRQQAPVIEAGRQKNGTTTLTARYPEGPFMWFRDGKHIPYPGWTEPEAIGDSMLINPEPGRYYVMGRSAFGCDVYSNEIEIVATSVSDNDVHAGSETSAASTAASAGAPDIISTTSADGSVELIWRHGSPDVTSVEAYDVLGRQLPLQLSVNRNSAYLTINDPSRLVLLVITRNTTQQVITVMRR